MHILGLLTAIFHTTLVTPVCFLAHPPSSEKWSTLPGKFFPYRVDPFQERRQELSNVSARAAF